MTCASPATTYAGPTTSGLMRPSRVGPKSVNRARTLSEYAFASRALPVRLIENRRDVHRTSNAGPLRTRITADVSRILYDELRRGRDSVFAVVHDGRSAVAGRRRCCMRAVPLIVVGVGTVRIVV